MFLNNNRLNDVKELLGAKIGASRAELERRSDRIEARLEKIGDNIARILADHEHRLTEQEGGKK